MDNTPNPSNPNVTAQTHAVHPQPQVAAHPQPRVAQPAAVVPQRPIAARPSPARPVVSRTAVTTRGIKGSSGTGNGPIGVFGSDANNNPEVVESPASIITTNASTPLTFVTGIDGISFNNSNSITSSAQGMTLGNTTNPITIASNGSLTLPANAGISTTGTNPLTINSGGQLTLSSTTGVEVQGSLEISGEISAPSQNIVLTPGVGCNVSVAAPLVLYNYPGTTPPAAEDGTILYNNNEFLFLQDGAWVSLAGSNPSPATVVGTQGQIVVTTNSTTNTSTVSIANNPKVSGTLSIQGVNSGFSNSAVNKSQQAITINGAGSQMLDLFPILDLFTSSASTPQQNGVVICTAVVSAVAYDSTTSAFIGCAGYDMGIQVVQIINGQVQLVNNNSTAITPVNYRYSQNFTASTPVWSIDYITTPASPQLALNVEGIASGVSVNYICSFENHITPISTN